MNNLYNLNSTTDNPFPYSQSEALQAFFHTLTALQQQRCRSNRSRKDLLSDIEHMQQDAQDDLNEQWEDLRELARNGLTNRIQVNLRHFMKDYARHVARRQFFRSDLDPWTLNEQTPGFRQEVGDKLDAKHDQLSSLLLCELQQALRLQANAIPQAVWEAHADARASLQQALNATKQAQDYVPLVMDPMVRLMGSVYQHHEQTLPNAIAQGVVKATKRKWLTRLTIFGLVLLGFLALFGCSFFAMMHI